MLALISTTPVVVLIKTSPGTDENIPAIPPPVKTGEALAEGWQYGVPGYPKVATGDATIVTVVDVVNVLQPPVARIVYKTVYVPARLVPVFIAPLEEFSDNPAGVAEKVPPVDPVKETCTVPAVEQ